MTKPEIFIGMPCFNSEQFIRRAIESIIAQDFANFKLVISDNASTDDSFEIARSYALRDSRIIALQHPSNLGAAENFRSLLDMADAPFLMFAGSHDFWGNDYVGSLLSVFRSNPDAVLVFGQTLVVDSMGNINSEQHNNFNFECDQDKPTVRALKIVQELNSGDMVYGVYKTAELLKCRTDLKCIGPDHVLLMEMALRGKILHDNTTVFYRREFRDIPKDEKVFRREQLGRIVGRASDDIDLKRVYSAWLLQHFLSCLNAPGWPVERIVNAFVIAYAFVIRWNQYLPKYVNYTFRVFSPFIRCFVPKNDGSETVYS